MSSFKDELKILLKQILAGMGVTDVTPEVEVPEDTTHGDYSTAVALKLAKTLKKPPMDIALQVVNKVKAQKSRLRRGFDGQAKIKSEDINHNMYKNGQKMSPKLPLLPILQDIDRVEVVKPGFINFFLTETKLSSQLSKVLNEKETYGTSHSEDQGRRIVMEFTDPNPFKEFHIGHLYSNSVGESLSRILESTGNTVRRVNYQGDVGMHVAKAIWGFLHLPELDASGFKSKSLGEQIKLLANAYASGATAFEEDSLAANEMKDLNRLIFIAAQELMAEKGFQPMVDYRQNASIDKAKLAKVKDLYDFGRTASLAYFESIYKRLGTKFDGYYFESRVGEVGVKIVRDHVSDGIFEESGGAIVFRGEKSGLHTRVFINSLGLPTYEAKELGLAPSKYEDFPYDRSIIVTGKEINEYFKVLIAALSAVNPELGKKTIHIGHGMVKLPEGKMSSRTGKVLTGEWLLEEVKKEIYNILQKSETKYDKEQQNLIVEKAAVAAVKYSLLKVSLPSDISFDLGKSVSFEGDSGPYLQYTYARCESVLRKAKDWPQVTSDKQNKDKSDLSLNSEELAVTRLLFHFPEVVADAAKNLTPNTLCGYLFKLAQTFNLFYAKHSILGSDKRQVIRDKQENDKNQKHVSASGLSLIAYRLSLTAATAQVLKNGLYLLGIEVLEQM